MAARRTARWALVLALVAAPAFATEAPWVLDAGSAERARNLLPEPVLARVRRGDYRHRVVPVEPARFRERYGTAFREASAANADVYDVDAATCALRERASGEAPAFWFGLPFPSVDPDDPAAGCRVAWNVTAAGLMANGSEATIRLTGLDRGGAYRTVRVRLRVMAFAGRHGGPIPNPEGVALKAASIAVDPPDAEGLTTLTVRHLAPDRPDDMWAFVPQLRRPRRLHPAARSEPLAGMDLFPDDVECHVGKVERWTWRLVGQGETLAPVVGAPDVLPLRPLSPTRWAIETPPVRALYETRDGPGVPWLVTEGLVLVPRPVWILEATPRDPYYRFGRVVMYVDRDMYRLYWKLVYDRAGEYFYNAMCGHAFARTEDGRRSAVLPAVVVGVNDRTDRAAIGGRPEDLVVTDRFDASDFTLQAITRSGD